MTVSSIFFILLQIQFFCFAAQVKTCQLGTLGGFQPAMICKLNTEFMQQKNMHLRRNLLLLFGSTGNGKSLIAQEFAKAANAELHTYSGPLVVNAFKGSGVQNIQEMFKKARNNQKLTVIFIENLDAFASDNKYGTIDDYVLAYKQFKQELDTLKDHPHIFVICTTNYIAKIAPDVMNKFNGHVCEIKNQTALGRKDLFKKFFCEKNWIPKSLINFRKMFESINHQSCSQEIMQDLSTINIELEKSYTLSLSLTDNSEQILKKLEEILIILKRITLNCDNSLKSKLQNLQSNMTHLLSHVLALDKTASLASQPILDYLVNKTEMMSVSDIENISGKIHELFLNDSSTVIDQLTIDRIVKNSTYKMRSQQSNISHKQSFWDFARENPERMAAVLIFYGFGTYALIDWYISYTAGKSKKKKKQNKKILFDPNEIEL